MGEVAAFALGVMIGLVIYWVIYRMYWHRWRAFQQRDMAYLQAKIESAQYTSMGLERHLAAQKADMAEQRSKIADLERDNRMSLARMAEMDREKQALITHLDALRAELAAYKKAVSEPELPAAPPPPKNGNGKPHDALHPSQLPQYVNPPVPVSGKVSDSPDAPVPTPAVVWSPGANGGNGRAHAILPIEQVLEPVLKFDRPRMCGDRLEIIQGIGPVIVRKLNRAGIDSFQALSQLTPEQLKDAVGPRTAKLLDAESVISQAKKLVGERRSYNGSH